MHDDTTAPVRTGEWAIYLGGLQAAGCFQGGSAIGGGICARKSGTVPEIARQISGFIRVGAADLEQARALLAGNPVFEAGGTVEMRELPRTD
jgi:hypothetical protein